ncbi:hypothetical protein KLP28_15170 [Nocardioidaceae bacterium]|nr:hypothetical protein KLP28_15170 [Nocardioidaceae bacterium]
MRLISAVLGFVLRKAGLFVGLVLSLFLVVLIVSALVPALQQARADQQRLTEVSQERRALEADVARLERAYAEGQQQAVATLTAGVTREVAAARRQVTGLRSRVAGLRSAEGEVCGFLTSLPEKILPGPDPCDLAQQRVRAAQRALTTFEGNLDSAQQDLAVLTDPTLTNEQKLARIDGEESRADLLREIENARADLGRVRSVQAGLQESQDSAAGWVVRQWAASWRWLALIAAAVLVAPLLFRTLAYYVLMPLVQRSHRPIHLAEGRPAPEATLRTSTAVRTLVVPLTEDEVLSARSEHVRPVQGSRISSRILYDWGSPFVSFAAGLFGLSRISAEGEPTEASLAPPDDPDAYLMRVDFADHPGISMHPRHVVAVIGAPEVTTRWRWGLQALATGQVRHILFAGTGSLIVQGSGDVQATSPGHRPTRMDQDLLMGFDSRLLAGVSRTDVFWPYLWGKRPLVDRRFTGEEVFFWQKSVGEDQANPLVRTFNSFFSAVGKVLGF